MINEAETAYESFVDILAALSLVGPSEKIALLALEMKCELDRLNLDRDTAEELIAVFEK